MANNITTFGNSWANLSTSLQNSSDDKSSLCERDHQICPDHSTVFMIISLLGIPLNVVHMIILSNMRELRGKPYLLLLYHINVVDIATSLMYFVVNLCTVKTAVLRGGAKIWIVVNICQASSISTRYFLLCLAMFEKYLGICKPYEYGESFFVRHVHLTVLMTWLFAVALVTAITIRSAPLFCFHEVYGPTFLHSNNPTGLLINVCLSFILNCLMLSFLAILIRELLKMQKRALRGDESLIRATAYIIAIVVAFYIFLGPFQLASIVTFAAKKSVFWLDILGFWMGMMYGSVNVVIYGWMSGAYRRQAKVYLTQIQAACCKCYERRDVRRVEPSAVVSVQLADDVPAVST